MDDDPAAMREELHRMQLMLLQYAHLTLELRQQVQLAGAVGLGVESAGWAPLGRPS